MLEGESIVAPPARPLRVAPLGVVQSSGMSSFFQCALVCGSEFRVLFVGASRQYVLPVSSSSMSWQFKSDTGGVFPSVKGVCKKPYTYLRSQYFDGSPRSLICLPLVQRTASQIQRLIAESYAEYMAGKYYVYGIAANLDLSSIGNGLDADGTKLYCSTMAKNVADRAIQVSLACSSDSIGRTLGVCGGCDRSSREHITHAATAKLPAHAFSTCRRSPPLQKRMV